MTETLEFWVNEGQKFLFLLLFVYFVLYCTWLLWLAETIVLAGRSKLATLALCMMAESQCAVSSVAPRPVQCAATNGAQSHTEPGPATILVLASEC